MQGRFLPYAWRQFWARPKQLAPPGEWFLWLVLAGRGFGKTRTGAEWLRERVDSGAQSIALVGMTPQDVRDVMIEPPPGVGSGIMDVFPPDQRPKYEPAKARITFHTGARAIVRSGAEPESLRGPQFDTAWCDELASWKQARAAWNNLMFGMRLAQDPKVCVTTTPKPIALLRELRKRRSTVESSGSSYENIANLSPRYIEEVIRPLEGTTLGQQEIYAAMLDELPGALWQRKLLDKTRLPLPPRGTSTSPYGGMPAYAERLKRIVVAIDPAVSAEEESNETGIVVAGIDDQKPPHGYLLHDGSGTFGPNKWARDACDLYRAFRADRAVAETNQGGALVEATIRTVNPSVAYKGVWASKGKHTRAEPVAALYEQGRIHHLGVFPELEDQLCTWMPGEDSPDRLDALVWAFTELMLEKQVSGGGFQTTI